MTNNISINAAPSSAVLLTILYAILAYFVYDQSLSAVFGVIVISIVVSLIFMLSIIPLVGWVAAILISYYVAIPALLNLVGIEYTWLITVILGLNAIGGFIVTVAMVLVIAAIFRG